jgi:protein-S-isoprenylcysteine O-methyltransferase Ste14
VRPLPYTSTAAQIPFYIVLVAFVLCEWRISVKSGRNRYGTRSDRGTLLVVVATVYGGIGGGFALAANVGSAAIRDARWPLFVAGVVLMAAGVVLRQWSVALLGRFFTTDVRLHEGQTVVDTGPYRRLRHPSYTGMLLTFLGLGLALGNWAALLALVVLPAIGLVVRIRSEERVLLAGLGEPYRRFAASRKRLIPGVW